MGLFNDIYANLGNSIKEKNQKYIEQQAKQQQLQIEVDRKYYERKVRDYVLKAVHILPDYLNINVHCPNVRCKKQNNTNIYETYIAKQNNSQLTRGRLIEIKDILNENFESINFNARLDFETQYESIRLRIQELNNECANPTSGHFQDMIYYNNQCTKLCFDKNQYDRKNQYLLCHLYASSSENSENYITVNVVVTEPSSFPVL